MSFVLGIDIGSASSKGIALSGRGVLGSFECPSGGDFTLTADRVRRRSFLRRGYRWNAFPALWPRDMARIG